MSENTRPLGNFERSTRTDLIGRQPVCSLELRHRRAVPAGDGPQAVTALNGV